MIYNLVADEISSLDRRTNQAKTRGREMQEGTGHYTQTSYPSSAETENEN